MKRKGSISLILLMALCLSGCGQTAGSNKAAGNMQSNVDKVMEQQMENADGTTQDAAANDADAKEKKEPSGSSTDAAQAADTSTVDYDLTNMNSDMVYSTVYQMMTDPETYVGKTVRMNGAYTVNYWESTDTYYHCVLIKDAQACCQQGIEFVWGDGSHRYPDDYPAENTEILVTGTFETYKEAGDDNLYCRLKDATMTVE